MSDSSKPTLAERLGVTRAVSPLRFRLAGLMRRFPSPGALALEDWLLDVANVRGADFVLRAPARDPAFRGPDEDELPSEELVAAICRVENEDRPQLLRAAAQLISQGSLNPDRLGLAARRERVERILAELARQALRVEPAHPAWIDLGARLETAPSLREPILHWTRLALPEPDDRGCNARAWHLIA